MVIELHSTTLGRNRHRIVRTSEVKEWLIGGSWAGILSLYVTIEMARLCRIDHTIWGSYNFASELDDTPGKRQFMIQSNSTVKPVLDPGGSRLHSKRRIG